MVDKLLAGMAASLITVFTLVAGARAVHMMEHAAHVWANAALAAAN